VRDMIELAEAFAPEHRPRGIQIWLVGAFAGWLTLIRTLRFGRDQESNNS